MKPDSIKVIDKTKYMDLLWQQQSPRALKPTMKGNESTTQEIIQAEHELAAAFPSH